MKKRFLFGLMAIILAGLGLGGVGMAAEDCQAKINDGDCFTLEVAIDSVNTSGTVVLLKDFTTNSFYVAADKNFTLDLNGKNLTLNNNTASCLGGFIGDTCYDYVDGNLTILDSVGNGKVIIRDAGIMPRAGGTLTIENGIFDTQTHSKDYMFYLGGGTLIINDGIFNGYYNIINCYADGQLALGGIVIINSGTFATIENDIYGNATVMGYGNSNIIVNGGKFTSVDVSNLDENYGIFGVFIVGRGTLDDDVQYTPAVAVISGGTFDGPVVVNDDAELTIEGGVFSEDPSAFLEDGYTAVKEGGKWVIVGPVAAIDEHKYSTLDAAITAAAQGQTVEILKSGTYTLPNLPANITIKGTVDGVIFAHNATLSGNNIANVPNGATFENVTFNLSEPSSDPYYHGFGYSDISTKVHNTSPIIFSGCVINGEITTYGKTEFYNTVFNITAAKSYWNVWVRYGDVKFDGCEFNGYDRNIHLHSNTVASFQQHRREIEVNNCTFGKSQVKTNKAAVIVKEIGTRTVTVANKEGYGYPTQYNLKITNSQIKLGDEEKYGEGMLGGSKLFMVDYAITGLNADHANQYDYVEDAKVGDIYSGTLEGGNVVVIVDGTTVYSTPKIGQTWTVTFDGTGAKEVADGAKVEKPTDPAAQGCKTFVEWQLNGVAYDFNSVVTGKLALTSKWSTSSCGGGGGGGTTTTTTTGATTTGDINTGDVNTGADTSTVDPQAVQANGYTNEMNAAYEFAYANGITTMKTIDEAEMFEGLTRIAMAKMLSQYAINVLGKSPADVEVPNFVDVTSDLDAEYDNGVTLAYKLGIMGINMPGNKFLPFEYVTRAQFGTALSRLLFGIEDGEDAYYTTHLAKLKEAGIITNDDPTLEELRGYVMLMLYRSANDTNTVNNTSAGVVSTENTNKPVTDSSVQEQEVEKYFTEAYRKGQIYGRIGDLQRLLKSLGYYNGEINNTFDNNTIDAVFDFQIAMGILPADDKSSARGNVGPKTRDVLNQKWAEFQGK